MTRSRSVLIIEDEPLIAMMLEDFIETLGHSVAGTVDSVGDALARGIDGAGPEGEGEPAAIGPSQGRRDRGLERGRLHGLGEVPVGAVVLGPGGEVIGRGRNTSRERGDMTRHAELAAAGRDGDQA